MRSPESTGYPSARTNCVPVSRTAYQRAYYRDTAPRRRALASNRRQVKHWAHWLLANLEWPAELAAPVPTAHPIRRPTLRLPRSPLTTRITK